MPDSITGEPPSKLVGMRVFDWIAGALGRPGSRGGSAFVEHPDFDDLYMRVAIRSEVVRHLNERRSGDWMVGFVVQAMTIVVARVASKVHGQGAWRRFVSELRTRFPGRPILVECVHSPLFAAHLARHGWRYVPDGPHYWLAGDDADPYAGEGGR